MNAHETYLDRMERQAWLRMGDTYVCGDSQTHAIDCDGCIVKTLAATGKGNGALRKRERRMDMGEELVLIGLDPGGTTGWALLVIGKDSMLEPELKILNNIALYSFGEFAGDEHKQVDEIEDMLDLWPGAAVVREDFILRTQNKNKEVLSPVRLGFAIDHLLYARNRQAFLQQPSLAKSTATDDRLKSWGLYRPGSEHARDATRHAITFARRVKDNKAMLRAAWPHLFSVRGKVS